MIRFSKITAAVILFCFFSAGAGAAGGKINELKSLAYHNNKTLKSIRDDIRKTIFTIKSRRPEENLPELTFYRYRVRNKENFWKVLSRSSLNMDTLMSVNGLTSPSQVGPGTILFIPNMRGVVVSSRREAESITSLERIDLRYVKQVNRSSDLDKKHIFVPCGKISSIERSLFLGTAFLSPLKKGRRTSGFGTRSDPFNKKRREFHRGVDIACPIGTAVHASRRGRVVFAGYKGGYGKAVIIEHEYGYMSIYGHLSRFRVKAGDTVGAGGVVALSGNTGRSTGPHLHFEIRKNGRSLNPDTFIKPGH